MIQTKENIGKLLERFVQGLTTESEEQLLSDYFSTAEAIPEEWMVFKELFDSFSTDVYDFSEDEKDAMLARVPRKKAKSATLWIWAVAACVVAVMVIAIPMMRNSGEMAQKPVAEIRRSCPPFPSFVPRPDSAVWGIRSALPSGCRSHVCRPGYVRNCCGRGRTHAGGTHAAASGITPPGIRPGPTPTYLPYR